MSRFAPPLTAFCLLWLVAPAFAAPIPVGPKPPDEAVPYPVARLLQHRKVQRELKMTAEQRITLYDTLEDLHEDYETRLIALEKMENVPEEAYDKLDTEHQKLVEKALTTAADKELTAAQRVRLRQVSLHVLGPAAFADAQVQKRLQLTDAQKTTAEDLAKRVAAQRERFLEVIGDTDEEKVRQEVLDFRRDTVKKFVEGLTAEQRDAWKAALGEPVKGFDVDALWLTMVEDEDEPTR